VAASAVSLIGEDLSEALAWRRNEVRTAQVARLEKKSPALTASRRPAKKEDSARNVYVGKQEKNTTATPYEPNQRKKEERGIEPGGRIFGRSVARPGKSYGERRGGEEGAPTSFSFSRGTSAITGWGRGGGAPPSRVGGRFAPGNLASSGQGRSRGELPEVLEGRGERRQHYLLSAHPWERHEFS